VVISHYDHATLPGGAIGVSIFFALSGYLITMMLLRAPRLDWSTVWRFLVRRFFRVYPPFLVSIGIVVAVSAWTNNGLLGQYFEALPSLLTFGGNPTGWLSMGVGILWTLQVEFMFYLAMPVIMLIVGRGNLLLITLICIAAYSTLSRSHPELLTFMPSRLLIAFPWFDTLIFGALVAIAERRLPRLEISRRVYMNSARALFGVLLFLVLFVANDGRAIAWHVEAVLASLVTAVWIYLYLQVRIEPNMPVIAWIGRISYALYLTHAIPIDYFLTLPWLPFNSFQLSKGYGLIGLSIAGAVALHWLVEKPSIRLGRWLTRKSTGPSATLPKSTAMETAAN
jgi:peptidoglycan/LPS O-acetylase OafA/YrhL